MEVSSKDGLGPAPKSTLLIGPSLRKQDFWRRLLAGCNTAAVNDLSKSAEPYQICLVCRKNREALLFSLHVEVPTLVHLLVCGLPFAPGVDAPAVHLPAAGFLFLLAFQLARLEHLPYAAVGEAEDAGNL